MFFKITSVAALIATVSAHMDMISPCPRYSNHGENCPALPAGASINYSMSSPLGASEPLCKFTTPYATPSATWSAGQSITVKFAPGGAAHGGGHCQFSLSYDNGKTFVVVHEELEHCFFSGPGNGNAADVRQYTFNLPANLPGSDKAVFAWTWTNAVGNREFYMNCADVAIKGSSGSYTGKEMTIANHDGYPTIPEFGGNPKTGLDIYAKAKQITVTGSGGSSGGPPPVPHAPSSSAAAPAPTTKAAPAHTTKAAPAPTTDAPAPATDAPAPTTDAPAPDTGAPAPVTTAAPAPETPAPAPAPATTDAPAPGNSSGGSCVSGAMQCSGTGYQVCLFGKWSDKLACGPGTACKSTGSSILCDRA
ncbi:hypothetical protein GQ54DRAFT_299788 [Martensiomyces pterosporus]|nr:hypothetical protein GQ54DRAFT_299788 [Martensiomyces pterosporus]